MTELELAWLAGILEGEGSFSIQKDKYPVGIWLHMTDEDVVAKVSNLFGTKYFKLPARKSHWKDSYKTALRGKPAVELLQKLLPFMGNRRTLRIKECLESFTIKTHGISQDLVIEIRQRFQNGEKPKVIAKDYTISFWRIYQLVRDLRK